MFSGLAREPTNIHLTRKRLHQVEPLIKFEESKIVNKEMVNQDHFIKQLLNLKNIKS